MGESCSSREALIKYDWFSKKMTVPGCFQPSPTLLPPIPTHCPSHLTSPSRQTPTGCTWVRQGVPWPQLHCSTPAVLPPAWSHSQGPESIYLCTTPLTSRPLPGPPPPPAFTLSHRSLKAPAPSATRACQTSNLPGRSFSTNLRRTRNRCWASHILPEHSHGHRLPTRPAKVKASWWKSKSPQGECPRVLDVKIQGSSRWKSKDLRGESVAPGPVVARASGMHLGGGPNQGSEARTQQSKARDARKVCCFREGSNPGCPAPDETNCSTACCPGMGLRPLLWQSSVNKAHRPGMSIHGPVININQSTPAARQLERGASPWQFLNTTWF